MKFNFHSFFFFFLRDHIFWKKHTKVVEISYKSPSELKWMFITSLQYLFHRRYFIHFFSPSYIFFSRNFTAATNPCCYNSENLASNTEEFPNILLTFKHTIHHHWKVAAYGQGTWPIFINIQQYTMAQDGIFKIFFTRKKFCRKFHFQGSNFIIFF